MRLCLVALIALNVFGGEWARFRGPNGSGLSDARNLPVEFNVRKNLVWKIDFPGGTSSPILAGERLYLTGFEKDDRLVMCLDPRTGKELWRRAIPKDRTEAANPLNGPSTPTPASDGNNIYVFFPEIGLLAFDKDGKQEWKTPLGPFSSVQGHAASPVLIDDLVVLAIDQTSDSFIAAYDAKSGKQRWKATRPSTPLGSYSTPIVYQAKGEPKQVIFAGGVEITGYQLTTGERLWWAPGFLSAPAASPIIVGDTLYANEPPGSELSAPFNMWDPIDTNKDKKIERGEIKNPGIARLLMGIDKEMGNGDGYLDEAEWEKFNQAGMQAGGLIALQIDGRGNLGEKGLRWRMTKSVPYLTAAIAVGNVVYIVQDGGILTAVNLENGEVVKRGRLEGAIDKYYSQPVAGDGKLYFTSENGKIAVVKAAPEWELLAVNDLDEPTYATPALENGHLFVRTRKALYCFGAN